MESRKREVRQEVRTQNCDHRQCSRRRNACRQYQRQSLVLFCLAVWTTAAQNEMGLPEIVEELTDILRSVCKIYYQLSDVSDGDEWHEKLDEVLMCRRVAQWNADARFFEGHGADGAAV